MRFDYITWLTNPYILMFLTVFTGVVLGSIKIGKFNFGASGCLFTGLFLGWAVYSYGLKFEKEDKGYEAIQNMISADVVPSTFFTLFLILFVVAVGLLAAKDLGIVLKKYGIKFVILGFAITLASAIATYGVILLSSNENPYEFSGVYTGALTSSPGLASAIETAKSHATERVSAYEFIDTEEKDQFVRNAEGSIGLGYAVAYPFGVIVVIFAINFLPKIFKIDINEERKKFEREMAEARKEVKYQGEREETDFDIVAFVIACFFGYSIGTIEIYLGSFLGYFSLGATGGALIGSLILGYIGKIGFINFRMNAKILSIIREFSLCFFLAIVGLRYGYQAFDAIGGTGAFLALAAIFVGITGILVGYFIGRFVFRLNWIMLAGAICGGMTSTPGLGIAIDSLKSDDPAAGYGAVYPFALLGMVLFTILLHKLPM